MAMFSKNVQNILFYVAVLIILYGAYKALFTVQEGKRGCNKACKKKRKRKRKRTQKKRQRKAKKDCIKKRKTYKDVKFRLTKNKRKCVAVQDCENGTERVLSNNFKCSIPIDESISKQNNGADVTLDKCKFLKLNGKEGAEDNYLCDSQSADDAQNEKVPLQIPSKYNFNAWDFCNYSAGKVEGLFDMEEIDSDNVNDILNDIGVENNCCPHADGCA